MSIASRMSVLSFCSEKQNGWLVKGKTPVLLLLIDSWKCQHAKQIALPLRHQSSGRFGCKVCQQAMQFALPLRHRSSGRFGCKVCQQAMQFTLPLGHQSSGRFGCKVCQQACSSPCLWDTGAAQIRLQSMSASNAVRLASETPEQRQIRLQSMSPRNAVRVALIQRKFLFSATKGAQNFMNTIIMSTVVKIFFLF